MRSFSYVVAKFALATNCPNGFVGKATPTYEFDGAAPAGAALQTEIDSCLDAFDAAQEPATDCGQHRCTQGTCTYDSEIVGTPTVVNVPAGHTHKHGFPTPVRHQITMTIQYGCWCSRAV